MQFSGRMFHVFKVDDSDHSDGDDDKDADDDDTDDDGDDRILLIIMTKADTFPGRPKLAC